ncbi:MAG TPA: protein kinase [Gemmatimonadaceae bacterium]
MAPDTARLRTALATRYAIERELGAGGMATVYLARDLRHERQVALKVLRPELAAVIGAERFLHEIRTTANLQHPHILPLFDSGEADTLLYYVMPYVVGESVRDKLRREKQLPIDEAVGIARAVASALDYAHRRGVIHRDIKPENVLLHDGQAVVTDFGIALAVSQAGSTRLTESGLSIGTPQYMSPEQAMGDRELDARCDIYSLGVMLYEMLAGDPPYTGSTAQAIVAKVITERPVPVTAHRDTVPSHVAAAIQTALAKLPADRFASASEFADALLRGAPGTTVTLESGAPLRGRPRATASRLLPWGIAAVSLAALAVVATRREPTPPAPSVFRASITLPDEAALSEPQLLLSRDGRLLAVTAVRRPTRVLYVRPMATDSFASVSGTDGLGNPFLSPDGRWVAFRSAQQLQKVALEGGAPVTLDAGSEGSAFAAGTWGEDGTIIYPRNYNSGLWRISADGGTPTPLTYPDSMRRELGHWWPQRLPDGDHVLFTAVGSPIDSSRIEILSLSSGRREVLLTGGVFGRYVPTGHLLYARDETIFAVPFDLGQLRVTGAAVPVLEDVYMDRVNESAVFAVADNGTMAYVPASVHNTPSYLVWVDRQGRESRALPDAARYEGPAISPDGRRVAVAITLPREPSDVWVLGLDRGTRTRLTRGGGDDFAPVWHPDGRRVVFTADQPVYELWQRAADAADAAAPLLSTPFDKQDPTFTPDGATVIFTHGTPGNALWTAPVDGSRPPVRLLGPTQGGEQPALSPDGQRLAYVSSETGRQEVYLVPYPDVGASREQVSSQGGAEPRWTRGGRELIYRSGERLVAVAIDPATGKPGAEVTLFSGPYRRSSHGTFSYAVTADGSRFLMVRPASDDPPRRIVIVTNWFEELRQKMGAR